MIFLQLLVPLFIYANALRETQTSGCKKIISTSTLCILRLGLVALRKSPVV